MQVILQSEAVIKMPAEVAQSLGLDKHSPYHFGEVTVQTQAGVRDISTKNGKLIRNYLNDQHKAFFQEITHLHVATRYCQFSGSPA